ncbi:NADase-type glycan-binding domain-containing protein [Streptomyces sp. NPDC087844]|uniref:NADase-type glycan-binding domain-containing protein n=1 Tax=Streptomyces sp. NPDC087844 TaxID=3365805 RepID=UPI00381B8887
MTSQNSGTGQEPARSCAECGTRAEPGQSFCDSCGAVLGWGTGRNAAAPVPAGAAAPARDSATGRGADNEPGNGPGSSQGSTPGNDSRDDARNEPGWDAFAAPGAGTGTARTAHDTPATAVGSAAGHTAGHTAGDETRRRDGGGHGGDSGSGSASTPSAATPPHPSAPAGPRAGAGTAIPEQRNPAPAPAAASPAAPADPAAPDIFSALTPRTATTATGGHANDTDTEPRVALGHGAPPPSAADTADERARSLLIPVNDPEPRAPVTPAVAPVLPGVPLAGRPQVRAPGPESGPQDGPPCPWCATPNRPDRHFCARCAMPMEGGPRPPDRQTWWRRLLNFGNGDIPWAGERPRLRRGFGRIMNLVVGAAVLGLIIALIVNIGDGIDATRDHFAKRAPVGPDSVRASRSYPGHSAQLAFDGLSNTWWGPGVSQTGEGEWVEARFDTPTRLLDVVITSGVSAKVEHLQESALPKRIEAQITTADGKKSTRILNLDRSAGGQARKFRVGEVVAVRFILRSAYAADAKKQVSIAEIELFGRSNGSRS